MSAACRDDVLIFFADCMVRERVHVMEQYIYKNQKKMALGITTGSCAALTAKAAALHLTGYGPVQESSLMTPKGIRVTFPVVLSEADEIHAEYGIQKDSGDDPDVTHGTMIYSEVRRIEKDAQIPEFAFRSDRYPNLYLDGGEGVGRVTQPGLTQPVGYAAINEVPRFMIFQAVADVLDSADENGTFLITVRIPEGKSLAKKTFNPRLGIVEGISVLGTSGIIEPMSDKAIVDTTETLIRQKKEQGYETLLVTPGNYGQGYVTDYLKMDLSSSIKCSNFMGETIDLAVSYGFQKFLLVGNIGKIAKLSAGIMNTHSHTADCRWEILAANAAMCGASPELLKTLEGCITTEEMLKYLDAEQILSPVMDRIMQRIAKVVRMRAGDAMETGVYMFSENYGLLGKTEGAEEILAAVKEEYQKRG